MKTMIASLLASIALCGTLAMAGEQPPKQPKSGQVIYAFWRDGVLVPYVDEAVPSPSVGQVKPGQSKPNAVKPNLVKPGSLKPSSAKPGQTKPGQTKPRVTPMPEETRALKPNGTSPIQVQQFSTGQFTPVPGWSQQADWK